MERHSIAKTAVVSKDAKIGEGTRIWEFAQVRENASIGKNCTIANGVYIDREVIIGNNVVIQNKSTLHRNLTIEDNVFIGPGVCFTNDNAPISGRIRELDGATSTVKEGATIGANTTILPDITIGRYAFIGAGSVVTKNVGDHQLVYGNPARPRGYACECRNKAEITNETGNETAIHCKKCNKDALIKK